MGTISEDPIQDDFNSYRYVNNSPANATDPSGLAAISFVGDGTSEQDVIVLPTGASRASSARSSSLPSETYTEGRSIFDRRIVRTYQTKSVWNYFNDAVADGYNASLPYRVYIGIVGTVFPSSSPSTTVVYDDGTRSIIDGGGPTSGGYGGQAAFLLGGYGAVASAGNASRTLAVGKELGKEFIESLASEAAGIPIFIPGRARNGSFGATGTYSGRPFDPTNAGGPIRNLTTDRIKITNQGVDVVEQHISRFDDYAPNQGMLDRLRRVERGELPPTQADLNYYSHELREYVRYRRQGWRTGVPDDLDARHTLWENAHTATLEDYRLREGPGVLFHPSVE